MSFLLVRTATLIFGVSYVVSSLISLFSGVVHYRVGAVVSGVSLLIIMVSLNSFRIDRRLASVIFLAFVFSFIAFINFYWSAGRSFFTVLVMLAAFGMAWSAIYFDRMFIFFELPFYGFLFLTILLVLLGYGPAEFNTVFSGYSRNGYSAILLLFTMGYLFSRAYKGRTISLVLLSMVVACSVPLYGRTGIAISLMLFIGSIWYRSSRLGIGLVFLISLFIGFFFSDISAYFLKSTNFSAGMESLRIEMWWDYLSRLTFIDLLFGLNLNSVPIIFENGGNPHNAFFLLHSYFGLGVFLLLVFLVISFLYLIRGKHFFLLVLLFCYLARAFFDIIYLFGLFDYLVFPVLFFYVFTGDNYLKGCREVKCVA